MSRKFVLSALVAALTFSVASFTYAVERCEEVKPCEPCKTAHYRHVSLFDRIFGSVTKSCTPCCEVQPCEEVKACEKVAAKPCEKVAAKPCEKIAPPCVKVKACEKVAAKPC
ncbi:MAG: hypothetical protein LBC74_14510, partial [Planctomycetaceae bacterium]|nr:hypothetical protein [Planctomycetaceae bacterium]